MSEFELRLGLAFPSWGEAVIVFKSLSPELGFGRRERSSSTVRVKKNILFLTIKAADRTALKASLNSFLKLINLSHELTERRKK